MLRKSLDNVKPLAGSLSSQNCVATYVSGACSSLEKGRCQRTSPQEICVAGKAPISKLSQPRFTQTLKRTEQLQHTQRSCGPAFQGPMSETDTCHEHTLYKIARQCSCRDDAIAAKTLQQQMMLGRRASKQTEQLQHTQPSPAHPGTTQKEHTCLFQNC